LPHTSRTASDTLSLHDALPIYVLQKRRGRWESVARMKLPRRVRFEDYAAVAVRGQQIAVVSQQDSRLWLGRFRPGDWTIVGRGRDRKSTRLNSSHVKISYAVFC